MRSVPGAVATGLYFSRSRSRRSVETRSLSLPVLTSSPGHLLQQRPRVCQHILNIESQIFQCHITGSRCTETIETNRVALWANITIPALPDPCFDRESRGDLWR